MDIGSVLNIFGIEKTVLISVDKLIPNPLQPRRIFNKDELYELSQSIKKVGLIQPIAVKRCDGSANDSKYEIIAGERRWRASVIAGLKQIPCRIFETDRQGSALMALVENLQRSDLSYFEEALAMQTLLLMSESTQAELSEALSISQSTLSNKLRLLRLSERERLLALENHFSERHCRALVRIGSEQERLPIIQKIIKENLSAPDTERLIESHINASPAKQVKQPKKKKPELKGRLSDMKPLYNTLDKAVRLLNISGYVAKWEKEEQDGQLVVRVFVRK